MSGNATPSTVRVHRTEEIEVTRENEANILKDEWARRYGDRPFVEGDVVRFTRDARQRHIDAFGEEHAGKKAVVTALSDNGKDVKVLAITNNGTMDEFWTPEDCLEGTDENAA